MRVQELMTKDAKTCHPENSLEYAAHLMWEHDFGSVPVVDSEQELVGILTDRDICMAAYTKGAELRSVSVSAVMVTEVHAVRPTDTLESAEELMRRHQVRRIPVLDADRRVVGILSLSDIARASAAMSSDGAPALGAQAISRVLAAIVAPRSGGVVAVAELLPPSQVSPPRLRPQPQPQATRELVMPHRAE